MNGSGPSENIRHLPIFPFLDEISGTLAREGLLLLSAETGAGKTTLFPWKLLSLPAFARNKILLLEPRRLAARAAADRISSLLGEKPGRTVGLRTRLETLVSGHTRLEVVTEGVLTRLLQADPSLSGYGAILCDEFHTRSLQGDLGLALAWDARRIFRPDLKLALLSATLPKEEIALAFGPWPVREVPGRAHPVEVKYRPPASGRETPWDGAARLCLEALRPPRPGHGGTILCFLPGYREMHRAREILRRRLPEAGTEVLLLHGRMPPEQQRRILDPAAASGSRVILATNVAETSLTVPGVTAVVDTGLERSVRFSPRTGLDHRETGKISQASAEQRKGRAGRNGPGICYRWWREDEFREAFSRPEILQTDLASLVLETSLWGAASPWDLTWLTPPPQAAGRQALELLAGLGLLGPEGRITPSGKEAAALAVHPRLGKMVLDAGSRARTETAAVIAAFLENDDLIPGRDADFRERLATFGAWAAGQTHAGDADAARRVREDARRLLAKLPAQPERRKFGAGTAGRLNCEPEDAGPLLLSAYPDRAAKRTRSDDPVTSRYLLASGRGAWIQGELAGEEFLVVADLDGGEQDARIYLAAPVSLRDLESGRAGPLRETRVLEWQGWKPRCRSEVRLGAMVLKEKPAGLPEPGEFRNAALSRLQDRGLADLPWNPAARRFLARCRFVGQWGRVAGWPEFSDDRLVASADSWLLPFGNWRGGAVWDETSLLHALEFHLGRERRLLLDQLAPESLRLPSGSGKRLDYESGDVPVLSARLQEFFGCVTTPRLCGQALMLDLLSPAGRTVQRTRDLDGFWDRTYAQVKKELMGRYPRHPWPDDPRQAKATAKPKTRRRKK